MNLPPICLHTKIANRALIGAIVYPKPAWPLHCRVASLPTSKPISAREVKKLQVPGTKRLVFQVLVNLTCPIWGLYNVLIKLDFNPYSTSHWRFRRSGRYRWSRHQQLRRLSIRGLNSYVDWLARRHRWRNDNFLTCYHWGTAFSPNDTSWQ